MKNLKLATLTISLTAALSACFFGNFHAHVLTKRNGVCGQFIDKGLTEYYVCEKCGSFFDLNENPIKNEKGIRINKYRNTRAYVSVLGKDLYIHYSKDNASKIEDTVTSLLKNIKEGLVSFDSLSKDYMTFVNELKNTIEDYSTSRLIADFFSNDEYYLFNEEIFEYYMYLDGFYDEINIAFANSRYKNQYYYGYTDEEINEIIGSGNDLDMDKINLARIKMNDAVYRFNTGENLSDCLLDYKEASLDYATLQGYEDYVDYAFKVTYSRDYTMDEAKSIAPYMKDTVYSLYCELEARNEELAKHFNQNQVYQYESLRYLLTYNLDVIEDYINNFMGDELKASYKHLLNSGNYFISSINNPRTTAYVGGSPNNEQIMFFGGSYQNTHSFIHEFGHYNAGLHSNAKCFDTAETQSQGNEALFYYYLLNEDKTLDPQVKEYFVNYRTQELLFATFGTYAVMLVEDYAYNHDSFTNEDLAKVWDDYFTSLDPKSRFIGNDINGYCGYFLLNSPLYAISYSTSALGALEIYAMANEDISKAKNAYKKIMYATNEQGFKKAYSDSGLNSVFEQSTFTNIYNAFHK